MSNEGGRSGVGRMLGLRRGPDPAQTRRGAPLRPFTLPNMVGYARIALLGAFLVLALDSDDGKDPLATACFGVAAGADYFDGMIARATGQYSRLGALMDPFIDRLLVLSGVVVVWHFELLPRWALAVLVVRELLMVVSVLVTLRLGLDLHINWLGRVSVWPTMAAFGAALVGWDGLDEALLYVGLAGAVAATVQYGRDSVQALRERRHVGKSLA